MVVWIIGLSGSGKSTLANKVVEDIDGRMPSKFKKTVLLDGDIIREIFDNDLGYSMEDRLINANRICQLGQFLESQSINVVCSILSIFPETRQWNRINLQHYFEVFIDAPLDTLIKRDSKGLYRKYAEGKISNVAGMDLDCPIPHDADYIIKNDASVEKLLSHSEAIVDKLCS